MIRATVFAAAALLAPTAFAAETAVDEIGFQGADVVFLGEVHDNPAHHVNQAAWVARMQPDALVFEMLTPQLALQADRHRDDPAMMAAMLEWAERGWPDFSMYYPIFVAAPEAAVFGAEVPRNRVRAAVEDGAAAVMGSAAPLFGLDRPLPEDQLDRRTAAQAEAHCNAMPEALLPGMVEAQRLRDAALARAVIAALAETGGPVAVITGNGHARADWGAPAMLSRARPDLSIVTVGQFEGPQDNQAPFDHWVQEAPVERADPCAVFRD